MHCQLSFQRAEYGVCLTDCMPAMVRSNTYWPDQFASFHRKCQHLHRSCSASSAQFWMRSVTYAGFLFECAGCAPLDEKDKNIKYSQHTLSLLVFFFDSLPLHVEFHIPAEAAKSTVPFPGAPSHLTF